MRKEKANKNEIKFEISLRDGRRDWLGNLKLFEFPFHTTSHGNGRKTLCVEK